LHIPFKHSSCISHAPNTFTCSTSAHHTMMKFHLPHPHTHMHAKTHLRKWMFDMIEVYGRMG
ncbi:hypothetical protein JI435_200150, partial [Parastagonospora nodorum SN15]